MSAYDQPGPVDIAASIRKAMQMVEAAPWPPEPHRHVVHPKAVERGGWTRCADCLGLVLLPTSGGE